jgi:hypothetical protein
MDLKHLKQQLDNWKFDIDGEITEHFYVESNNKENLIIAAGDSWTWGGGLDSQSRLKQVYGKQLATALDADWLNIGCSGWSNSWILLICSHVVELLKNSSYKKIYLVLTLTETGRDLKSFYSFPYNYIQTHNQLGTTDEFYDKILEDIECYWIEQLQKILAQSDDRYVFFIGQNFVWHDKLYQEFKNKPVIMADTNWIELLADYQNLPRPIRTNMVCGWIFDTLATVNTIVHENNNTQFKIWALPKIEKATLVNIWLESSDMNYKQASKHPVADGHRLWADYIIKCLKPGKDHRL